MAFEWMMKLNDMVSDPATRIARKLHDVEQQLLAIDYAVKRRNLALMNPGIKKDIAALETERIKLRLLSGELNNHDRVSSSLVARFRHLRQASRDWLLILTPLAMGLRFVYGQAKQLAQEIIAPIRAVEEASLGMKAMFGTKVGDQLVQMVQDLGPRVGRPIAELFKEATKLGISGAPAEMMRPMLLAMEDMKAMGKDTTQLEYILQSAWSRPVASIHEMVRGMSRVVNETKVWKQLASDMGVGVGDLNWMISKNLIGGGQLSTAVLEVLQAMQGGKLGKTAFSRADTTMGGMIDTLSARMEKLIMSITGTKGFGTLKLAMKNLVDVLGDSSLQTTVTKLADSIGAMLEPLTGPDGKKSMQDFFAAMSASIDEVLPGLKALVRVTGWFAKQMLAAGGGGMMGAGLISELASMQQGPIGNVLNAIPGMLFRSPIQLSDEATQRLGPSGVGSKRFPGYPLNVSVPITIHADTAARYQDLLPEETKNEILKEVSDAIDRVNAQTGGTP